MEKEQIIKKEGETLFVKLDYKLSTGNATDLLERMSQYRGQDIKRIVFDATDLVFISSAGIRVVIYAQQRIGDNAEIVFVNCAKEIYETLKLTGIHSFITFIDDRKKGEPEKGSAGDKWQKKLSGTRQKMLDHFAANNDVVMYQMRLGQEDEEE